ncbi:kinase-like domain-containing protein [Bisporella sp. PMI_857]|nr:kinase-like domain-containing protein [Bisporella sp. PMI_857]
MAATMAKRTWNEMSNDPAWGQQIPSDGPEPATVIDGEAAGLRDLPFSLDTTTVQIYPALEDVLYKRDLYTLTGVGAFGCVFRAVMEPNQVFAVKEIKFSSRKEKENMGEVEFLRRCQHPNILRMIEVYVVDHPGLANAMYVVMSLWAPETLYAFFKDLINSETCISPLCPWYVPGFERPWTAITRGCISAVEYLHKHNIRHRDIKPENILLHCKGFQEVAAVIADFGISKNSIMNAATTFHGTY